MMSVSVEAADGSCSPLASVPMSTSVKELRNLIEEHSGSSLNDMKLYATFGTDGAYGKALQDGTFLLDYDFDGATEISIEPYEEDPRPRTSRYTGCRMFPSMGKMGCVS
jgi:hypothetical protein